VWKKCVVQQTADFVSLDSTALKKHPLGLQRHLLRHAIDLIHPQGMDVSFATLERATKFVNDTNRRPRMDLAGGMHLLREGLLIYLLVNESDLSIERWPQMPDDSNTVSLKVPGSITLSGGWKLNCEHWNIASLAIEQTRSNNDPYQVWLDANEIADALELRARQDGDRFEPLGMDGHEMKISDFFINEKLPQRARDRWPLLCMGDKVVWVPGHRPAHSFRLTEATKKALYFSMTRG